MVALEEAILDQFTRTMTTNTNNKKHSKCRSHFYKAEDPDIDSPIQQYLRKERVRFQRLMKYFDKTIHWVEIFGNIKYLQLAILNMKGVVPKADGIV